MAKKIIIAGGGASGMCAAIYAARNGANVTIIEKNNVLGKKLSMTGNGRCNLTNLDMREDCFNAAARTRMKSWLAAFGATEVIRFFGSLGVVVRSEDGYIYPASGQATTVVTALCDEIRRLGVTVVYEQQVKRIEVAYGAAGDSRGSFGGNLSGDAKKDSGGNYGAEGDCGGYVVVTDKDRFSCDAVIMATGSLSGPKTTMSTGDGYYICRQLGMSIKDTFPALVGFKCDREDGLPQAGVRSMANVSFYLGTEELAREYGEVQITPEGISGIPVMQASREVVKLVSEKKPVYAEVDFFPDYDDKEFEALKQDMMRFLDKRTLGEFLQGFGNSNINELVMSRMKLGKGMKMKNISPSMAECILDNYRKLKFRIVDCNGYQASQVTTGGVSLGDIGDHFAYVNDNGIYCIGELLDVDGRCGGYNLQWAFMSGSIAGTAASM
ncbi:MAG: NAD(P)/FAD-dependent oxidoreductase [Butyrivibrio sp.]|nr:NAD(P)/FAD-dependent oxidoreductase [Butyrivibrio sp.]